MDCSLFLLPLKPHAFISNNMSYEIKKTNMEEALLFVTDFSLVTNNLG